MWLFDIAVFIQDKVRVCSSGCVINGVSGAKWNNKRFHIYIHIAAVCFVQGVWDIILNSSTHKRPCVLMDITHRFYVYLQHGPVCGRVEFHNLSKWSNLIFLLRNEDWDTFAQLSSTPVQRFMKTHGGSTIFCVAVSFFHRILRYCCNMASYKMALQYQLLFWDWFWQCANVSDVESFQSVFNTDYFLQNSHRGIHKMFA